MLREKPVQVSRWAKANTWSANEGAAWERPADFYKFLPQHPGMYMEDEACAEALARGFARFVKFLVASKLDDGVREPRLAPVRMLFPGTRLPIEDKFVAFGR